MIDPWIKHSETDPLCLAAPEETILKEIAMPGNRRNDVASIYNLLLRCDQRDRIDWGRINRAIIGRWSMSALVWIKRRAWSGKCFEEIRKLADEAERDAQTCG